ncbi:MAG: hypothetical protein AAGG01_09600 [Planctomycetota bacterium]
MSESDEAKLAALAGRLFELRDEKKYLETEIEKVSLQLAAAVGEGTKRTLGKVDVRVTEAKPGLRIVREADVPESFLTPKPDRKRLLEHVKTTGEVPSGVEVTEGRPVVYVKAAAES